MARPTSRNVFPRDSPRPLDLPLSVPLRPRSVPCVPQEGTPRRRLCAPRSGAAQGLGTQPQPPSRTWSPRVGLRSRLAPVLTEPPPSPRHPHLVLRSPALGPQLPASGRLSAVSKSAFSNSADSSHPAALSHFSHFFPLLEFDSGSPQNGMCTKAATPNLDLHTPLRFVFNCIN